MPAETTRNRYALAGLVIASGAGLLYSALYLERILLGVAAVILLVILYLVWRLVRTESEPVGP